MSNAKKIRLVDIMPFKDHPFNVEVDSSLHELAQSIKENGLLNPVIVRPRDNKFEMVSGHRRLKALEINGADEVDAYIKELTDDDAVIFMVDSNLQREKLLPSEKAFAYKMKMDAMKHQGKKLSTSATELHKSRDAIAKGESGEMVRRYIRLTYLIPELLRIVDNTAKYNDKHNITMGIKPAVELSYLTKDEQTLVYSTMIYDDLSPSHAQTIRIRKLSEQKRLNAEELEKILSEEKGNQHEQISFNRENIERVLPYELTKRDKRYIESIFIVLTYISVEDVYADIR